ncbi:MAG: M28 family metallopeptidase [Steroidobacteraceae bacterium]
MTLLAAGCGTVAQQPAAAPVVTEDSFRAHLAQLASDEFEGRKPTTRGEERTIAYLSENFEHLGLKPANGTSYLQDVPLVELTAASDASLEFDGGKSGRKALRYGDDMVIWTKRVVQQSGIADSPLVFVGYGIVAPEYGWNDYQGIDMRGKTAVILINDPGFATSDPKLFNGRAMTYYGRWVYKYEEAARQGAAAAIIIHDTEPAAYPWQTVVTSWTGPQLDMQSADGNAGRVAVEGWIQKPIASALFAEAGLDLDQAMLAARTKGFRPTPLAGLTASAQLRNAIRRANSHNVAAILPGRSRPNEYIMYMAHWDHLGRMLGGQPDTIFNGAIDNATGTAGLLAIAEALAAAGAQERSIMFVSVTAEESGLLGSAYYAANPLVPLRDTVAVFNMDAMHFGGRTRDVTVVGYGASELDDYLKRAAVRQDRIVEPEPTPEKGFYYRSDHFNMAKKGVPALYIKLGIDDREHGRDWGREQLEKFTATCYHQTCDNYSPDVRLDGSTEDLNLLLSIGREIANDGQYPNWRAGNEFRAIRDRSRAED